jgi:hypothetical protein
MPILWIAVYCLIAVAVLFALTFHNEMLDEKSRCDKIAKPLKTVDAAKPAPVNLPNHS